MPDRIDRAWLREHGGSIFELHLNMSAEHRSVRRVVDRRDRTGIGLSFTDVSYRRTKRNGAKGGTSERWWHVDGHEPAISDLDEALEILDLVRRGDERADAARQAA